jgi:hypothetical protein
MGYDVHITRADDWFKSKYKPIMLEEWLSLVDQDTEMRFDGIAEAVVSGGVLRVEGEGLSVWTAYSKHGEGGNMAWFDFAEGRVVVKNPDDEILAKMKQIAQVFNARVVGDDGETY